MTYDEIQKWLDEQIEKAREYRKKRGNEPMTQLEESALRDRLRQAVAR